MRLNRRTWIAISLIAIMASSFLSLNARETPLPDDTKQATSAPDFTLPDIEGRQVQLKAFRGKTVIINFWATWCGPCKKEIPDFVDLYDKYHKEGLEIVGVALASGATADVRLFAQRYKMNYPVVMGDERVARAYGNIKAIPTTFVIDQEGRIYKHYVGYRSRDVFESDIRALLNRHS